MLRTKGEKKPTPESSLNLQNLGTNDICASARKTETTHTSVATEQFQSSAANEATPSKYARQLSQLFKKETVISLQGLKKKSQCMRTVLSQRAV